MNKLQLTLDLIPVASELPDAYLTVLLFNENWEEDDGIPMKQGFHDGTTWCNESAIALEDLGSEPPTFWCDIPNLKEAKAV